MTDKEYRNKLIATFWLIVHRHIDALYVWELGEKLYPRKITAYPGKGLTNLTIEELETFVKRLCDKLEGAVTMPVRNKKQFPGLTAGQQHSIYEHLDNLGTDPATPGQITEMNRLANELELTDSYFLGIVKKATGKGYGPYSRLEIQKVIEALKYIQKRPAKEAKKVPMLAEGFPVSWKEGNA
jgi:hypothetical protein